MITHDTLHAALGKEYQPDTFDYVIAERGPQMASKIVQGWRISGELTDQTHDGSILVILSRARRVEDRTNFPAVKSRIRKLADALNITSKGKTE